eukprot:15358276-Ditylum_brightwellii.AAC.1
MALLLFLLPIMDFFLSNDNWSYAYVLAVLLVLFFFGIIPLSALGKPQHKSSTSAVLIMGGSQGRGQYTADYLISKGYSVLVTI